MRYLVFFGCLMSLALVSGCGTASSEKDDVISTDLSGKSINITNPVNNPDSTTAPENVVINGQGALTPSGIQASPSSPVINTSAGSNLNPAHGQPGHRCDIAVGAPLNSPAPANYTPPTTSSPAPSPVVNATVPAPSVNNTTTTAPGMNPAHGQPGHRCDIPVGAPLNSKPAENQKTTTTPVNLQTTPTAPAASPVVSPASPTATIAGMNPAHGQPGHRCDIPVGAPLSTPVKKN